MATYSNILAQRIPWTVEPGELQSMASQRVGHDLATKQQQQQQHTHIWKYEKSRHNTVCSQLPKSSAEIQLLLSEW